MDVVDAQPLNLIKGGEPLVDKLISTQLSVGEEDKMCREVIKSVENNVNSTLKEEDNVLNSTLDEREGSRSQGREGQKRDLFETD